VPRAIALEKRGLRGWSAILLLLLLNMTKRSYDAFIARECVPAEGPWIEFPAELLREIVCVHPAFYWSLSLACRSFASALRDLPDSFWKLYFFHHLVGKKWGYGHVQPEKDGETWLSLAKTFDSIRPLPYVVVEHPLLDCGAVLHEGVVTISSTCDRCGRTGMAHQIQGWKAVKKPLQRWPKNFHEGDQVLEFSKPGEHVGYHNFGGPSFYTYDENEQCIYKHQQRQQDGPYIKSIAATDAETIKKTFGEKRLARFVGVY